MNIGGVPVLGPMPNKDNQDVEYSGSGDITNHVPFIVHKLSNNTAYA